MQCPELSFVNKITKSNQKYIQTLKLYERRDVMSDKSSLQSLHSQLKACDGLYQAVRNGELGLYC